MLQEKDGLEEFTGNNPFAGQQVTLVIWFVRGPEGDTMKVGGFVEDSDSVLTWSSAWINSSLVLLPLLCISDWSF